MCGDMTQFFSCALFMPASSTQQWSVHALCLFESVERLFLLKTLMNQIGPEQEQCPNVLTNIVNGIVFESDSMYL